jgi:hypothetical protein
VIVAVGEEANRRLRLETYEQGLARAESNTSQCVAERAGRVASWARQELFMQAVPQGTAIEAERRRKTAVCGRGQALCPIDLIEVNL